MGSLSKWARWRRPPKRGEPCLVARRPDQRRQEQTPETRAPRSAAWWSKGGKGPPARARPSRRRSAVKPGWRERECRRKERGSLLHWKENSMHGSVLARANVHSAVNCVTLGERAVQLDLRPTPATCRTVHVNGGAQQPALHPTC